LGKHHHCVFRLRRTLAKTATRTMIVAVAGPVATTSLALVLAGFTLTSTTTGVRRRRKRAG
jgi:hypothetical protein